MRAQYAIKEVFPARVFGGPFIWFGIVLTSFVVTIVGSIPSVGIIASCLALASYLILFIFKPHLGMAVLLLEVVFGGNGRWVSWFNGMVTPRYLLIVGAIAGYGIHSLLKKESIFPRALTARPLLFFFGVLCYGVLLAIWNGNPEPIQEAQVWTYLVLYFIWVNIGAKSDVYKSYVRLFLWSTAGMCIVQLVLMLALNLAPGPVYGWTSLTPLEEMRILMTLLEGTSLWYVFWGNSALCGFVLAASILLLNIKNTTYLILSRSQLLCVMALSTLSMVFSMTRGTWGQLGLTLFLVGFGLILRRRISVMTMFLPLILISLMFSGLMINEPVRDAFVARFNTLLVDSTDLSESDSIILKAQEGKYARDAIMERPILGYGFGIGQYGEFRGDSLALTQSRFHNYFLGFALKTGILGLLGLLGVLIIPCIKALRIANKIADSHPEEQALLEGLVYGVIGTSFASTSNPHIGTPGFVCELAFLMALTDLFYRKWLHSKKLTGEKREGVS